MIALQLALLLTLPWLLPRTRAAAAAPPLDIGAFFTAIVTVYATLPLIGFALAFAGVGAMQEERMGDALPDVAAVVDVGWMFVLFVAGFVLAYRRSRRGRGEAPVAVGVPTDGAGAATAFALFVVVQAALAFVRWQYGIGSGSDYLDSYAVVREQPLVVQQVVGVLQAADFAAAVLFIVSVLAWRPRAHGWVALFVGVLLLQTFVTGGSRAYAFRCALAYVVARSVCGPKLRRSTIVVFAVLGVLAFLAAGAIRQTALSGQAASPLTLFQGGEFVAYFYNGLDLQDKAADIRSPLLSAALYLVDLLRLVPRQIIGDFKVDPAAFYASTFYPDFYESGGAYAFGAIAESALGFGAAEALVRGALLGLAYGAVRRLVDGPRVTTTAVFAYTWFVVLAYEGLRDTTFSVFPRFVLQVLPLLVVARLLGILKPARPTQPVAPAPATRIQQA